MQIDLTLLAECETLFMSAGRLAEKGRIKMKTTITATAMALALLAYLYMHLIAEGYVTI